MPEPAQRIEVFTGAGRRRNWSPEEKARIIAESSVEGETLCAVARRHGLTAQQLFTWRRQARAVGAETPVFVPAVSEIPAPPEAKRPRRPRSSGSAAIELEIDGVVARTGPGAQTATVAAVIRALKAKA